MVTKESKTRQQNIVGRGQNAEVKALTKIMREHPFMPALMLEAIWQYRDGWRTREAKTQASKWWADIAERAGQVIEAARAEAGGVGRWPTTPPSPRVWPDVAPLSEESSQLEASQHRDTQKYAPSTIEQVEHATLRADSPVAVSREILSVSEAAILAGCSERTMAAGLRTGMYPGTKRGRGWVVPRALLETRLAEIAAEESAKRRAMRPHIPAGIEYRRKRGRPRSPRS